MAAPSSFSLRSLRLRLERGGIFLIQSLFWPLPLSLTSWFMGKVWQRIGPRTRRHRRAQAQLAQALPELSEGKRQEILWGMWENLGRVFAEALFLPRLLTRATSFSYQLDSVEPILNALPHRSCVMVSLHSGNWEIAVLPALLWGFAPAGVYQTLTNPFVEKHLYQKRAPLYPGGLLPKCPATARRLRTYLRCALKAPPLLRPNLRIPEEIHARLKTLPFSSTSAQMGGAAVFLADLRENGGVRVPFFDQTASATPFPVFLARSLGIPLLAGRVIRRKGLDFVFDAEAVKIPHTDSQKEDIQKGTERLHQLFERWIREYPEQFLWTHRKWDVEANARSGKRSG